MSPLAAKVLSVVAGQLGNPHGVLGKGVARFLNRGNRVMIEAAVAAADPAAGARAADIGFGGGAGLALLLDRVGASGTVTGIEPSRDMLARAGSRFSEAITTGRLTVREGTLSALPLADASQDAVITTNTVYFVPDLDAVCTELARVLAPGGRVVVAIGDPDAMAKMPFTRYGFRLRPVEEVIAAMERAALTVEHRPLPHKPIPAHLLIGRRA